MKRKYAEIKRKQIVMLTVMAIISAVVMSVYIGNKIKRYNEWEATRSIITVTIRYGDTLDYYAEKYSPEWLDYREYRAEILKLNGKTSSSVYAGETIKLYVED